MQQEIRSPLIRYVELLQEQGEGFVRLDAVSRAYLQQLTVARPSTALSSQPGPPTPTRSPVALIPAPPAREQPLPSEAARFLASREQRIDFSLPHSRTKAEQLDHLRERATLCQKCPHLAASRRNVVFGQGNPEAGLMFVGEAPGEEEDRTGEPFVGRAGELLTKMIAAMGLSREQVYIANIVKCRPDVPAGSSGNRKPTAGEIETCAPYVNAQIGIVQPKVMVGLGATAVEGLLGSLGPISQVRGQFRDFRGIPFMPTFHPSYLLRNPSLAIKRQVWEDLLQVMTRLEMPISEKQRAFFLTGA